MERHNSAKFARRQLEAAEREASKGLTVDQRIAVGAAYAQLAHAEELNRLALIISKRDGVSGLDRQ